MSSELLDTVRALPITERISLIEELWQTIEDTDLPEPTADEVIFAQQRLADYRKNPNDVVPLETLQKQWAVK